MREILSFRGLDIQEHSRRWERWLSAGFQSPEQNDLAFCAQDSIMELPPGSEFIKDGRKDPLESELEFPPKSKSAF